MTRSAKFTLAAMLLAASMSVQAESDTWAVMTLWSYHQRGEMKQDNYGVGIEHGLTSSVRAVAGQYRNSNDRNSVYLGAQVRGFCQDWGAQVCAAATIGLVSGYGGSDAYRPAVVPAITIEGRHVGANVQFGYWPETGGALALQMKVRF